MLRFPSKLREWIRFGCRWKSHVGEGGRRWKSDVKDRLIYGGDLEDPVARKSLGRLLYERLSQRDRQDKIFQVCKHSKVEMTTQEHLMCAVAMAEGLRERGIKKGDFIFLIGGNSLFMNTALTGIFFMGAVPCPISNRTNIDEFKILLKRIKPKFFVCDVENLFLFRPTLQESEHWKKSNVILLNKNKSSSEYQSFVDFMSGKGDDYESFQPADEDKPEEELAVLIKAMTPGPPGRAVGITHFNLNAVVARYEDQKDILPSNVILMVHKVTWTSGINSLLVGSCFGSKIVVMKDFDEETFMQAIEDYKVTITALYSTRIWQLFKYKFPKTYDVSTCKNIFALDGALPKALIQGMEEKTGLSLTPCFALNELTGLAMTPTTVFKEECVGKLIPLMYGKVVKEGAIDDALPREVGEIRFKGPTLSKGYFEDPESTKGLFDENNYLRSGVYGYYDEDGDFFVVDKISDVFKYKGINISPRKLEWTIRFLVSVKDVAVCGLQHATDGHVPIAFIVLEKGHKLTAEEIIQFVNGQVEDHKKLRGGVIFLSKIPRSKDNGEIKRNVFSKILSKYQVRLDAKVPGETQEPTEKNPSSQSVSSNNDETVPASVDGRR